jgi:hypothetical protein
MSPPLRARGPVAPPNLFLDNYVRLVCTSAPDHLGVTLFCPNFNPDSSGLGLQHSGTQGEFALFTGRCCDRDLRLVCGFAKQADMLLLFNTAAFCGQIHDRPTLLGVAGEGSFAEALSVQCPTQAVFPIYSPRYDYQEANLCRLASLSPSPGPMLTLVKALIALDKTEDFGALWAMFRALAEDMRALQLVVQRDHNFLNLLVDRIMGRGSSSESSGD